jgi:hypothetical protein
MISKELSEHILAENIPAEKIENPPAYLPLLSFPIRSS